MVTGRRILREPSALYDEFGPGPGGALSPPAGAADPDADSRAGRGAVPRIGNNRRAKHDTIGYGSSMRAPTVIELQTDRPPPPVKTNRGGRVELAPSRRAGRGPTRSWVGRGGPRSH